MSKDSDFLLSHLFKHPFGGCWEWIGPRDHKGYGQITSYEGGAKKTIKAHRIAWKLWRGEIPESVLVLHRCDNPPCCNPGHLFLGTHQDNYDDCRNKGRVRTGTRHPRAKLSVRQLVEICALNKGAKGMAGKYGLHPRSVTRIRGGDSYPNEMAFILADVMHKTGWVPEEIAAK